VQRTDGATWGTRLWGKFLHKARFSQKVGLKEASLLHAGVWAPGKRQGVIPASPRGRGLSGPRVSSTGSPRGTPRGSGGKQSVNQPLGALYIFPPSGVTHILRQTVYTACGGHPLVFSFSSFFKQTHQGGGQALFLHRRGCDLGV